MKVSQLMSDEVVTCRISDTLQHAAGLMWDRDVGCIPVLDGSARLLGMLTDRDICMSAYARGRSLREISVIDAMSTSVYSCGAGDDVANVMRMMARHKIRRVPVLDDIGHVIGVLSLDDVAAAAAIPTDVSPGELASTFAAVSGKAPAPADPMC